VQPMKRAVAGGLVVGVLACALLVFNTAARQANPDLASHMLGWRGWDDVTIATAYQVSGDFPVSPYPITNQFWRTRQEDFLGFRDRLVAAVTAAGLHPTRFWQTFDARPLFQETTIARRYDDSGRAWLLGLWFRVLGGSSPFFISWLGALTALPLLIWIALELAAAGRLAAAATFLGVLACWAFAIDLLALSYAAVAFYLVALLAVVPLAVYATMRRPTIAGLLWRCAAAGPLLGLCLVSRRPSLLVLPGFLAAFAIGLHRCQLMANASRVRRLAALGALFFAGLALLLGPQLVLASHLRRLAVETAWRHDVRRLPPQEHDTWITLWQGLGDFDREKGHIWLDKAGENAVLQAGGDRRLSPRSERILRDLILRDITGDPVWYVGILVRRLGATVLQRKLWPWTPLGGRSMVAADDVHQGVMDNYYNMLAQSDVFSLGARSAELPMALLLMPTAGLLLAAAIPRLSRRWPSVRADVATVACLAAGALPAPVLITTASAFEAESFMLVHLLAAAFLMGLFFDRGQPS
jgi:hypothetical protein